MTRTPEQIELAEITASLLAKRADGESTRRALATDVGFDTALWTVLCEQIGVAALAVPEEYDGAGATLAESHVVLEALGYALTPNPMLATTLAVAAVRLVGTDDQRAEWLPRLAAGEIGSVGWTEFADGYLLDGPAADLRLWLGPDLAALDGPCTPVATMDQLLRLGAAPPGPRSPHAGMLTSLARVLISALQVGVAQRGLDMTVAYAKERVQFGRPIGSFQAIKHRLADCLVLVESARSAAWAAADAAAGLLEGHTDAESLHRAAAVASSYCTEAARHVAAETIQLHGGIAITWEHDAHLVFKAAHSWGQLAGEPHRVRAELG